jgi:glycosyltransferase involved in cell wall biosynthesis
MPENRVSVVMPVRNGEQYLRDAIESVLGQTYRRFQFVIVDDQSTDGTADIIHWYAARDARVEVVRGPGTGIVGALKAGMARATGEYLARMDGDDVCLPERFERQVEWLDARPECVLVGSRVLLMDGEGEPIREWCAELAHEEIDQAHMAWGWPVVHPAVMMRRDAVDRVGGYREQYTHVEDLDLFLRLAEVGRLCNLPEVLLKYRKHLGSVCQTKGAEQERLKVALYEETRRRRGIAGEEMKVPEVRDVKQSEVHRLWGWWALQAGHLKTARKHAVAALKGGPWSVEAWRLMYCAVRGH